MTWNRLHVFVMSHNANDVNGPICECGQLFRHPIHLQNGGEICDIVFYPCVCGSWHPKDYEEQANREFKIRISQPGYQPTEYELEIIKLII